MNILEIENLEKTYKLNNKDKMKVLKSISLQVKKGELVAVMGPSGSGKTTLLNILSGIDCADKGRVLFNLKLQLEFEDEHRKYRNLYKMGMQEKEFRHLLLNKHYFMFMVPVFLGAIIAMFYNYLVTVIYNYGWIAVKYCGIVSIIVIIVQTIFVKIYTSAYSKGLIDQVLPLQNKKLQSN